MPKTNEFKLPYVGISTDKYALLYCQNGDYSVIIKCSNPVLQYSANDKSYYSFHNLFDNIIKILDVGYTLQKQDIFSKRSYLGPGDENDFLNRKYHETFNGRDYTEIGTYLIITQNVKRSAFFTYDQRTFKTFIKNIDKVIELLHSKELNPRPLNENEINIYVKRILALNFSEEHFSLNNFKATSEEILIADRVIKNISLVDVDEINLPSTLTPHSEVNDLGYPFPVDLFSFMHDIPGYENIIYNQIIVIPKQDHELGKIQAKRRRHESMPDPANNVSVKDIDDLLIDVAQNNRMLVYAHFNIVVHSHASDIDKAVNFIESALFSSGIIPSKNSYNQMELFRSALPGNSGELQSYDKFLTTSDAALCFFFKERLLTDEPSDFKIYFSDRKGIPVAIDTFELPMNTNRINNRNKFIIGPSGSGKSFGTNHIVRQYKQYDMDIILVDTGHSYSGLCSYFSGRYITYSEEKPITMNPFRLSRKEFNEEKREFLKSLVGLLWKGADGTLNQIEDSVLSSVVLSYYVDFYNVPEPNQAQLSFNSFYEYSINKINEIIKKEQILFDIMSYQFILKKFYQGGEFETILNDDLDSTLFDESFIVFEIDAIKEHKILFPITTIIIMDVFLQKMRHKTNRKALIIEEAWKAIASPMMAGYIVYLYKTVRKFRGLVAVVTQEIEDIIGNEIVKNSIINNSDTIILLDQTKFQDNYEDVAKLLSLNEVEQRKIFSINNLNNKSGRNRFKEVYIKRGATGEVYGVEVSDYEYLIYTTERREKEALQVYVDKHKDYQMGLEAFVHDLRKSNLKLDQFIATIKPKKYNLIAS